MKKQLLALTAAGYIALMSGCAGFGPTMGFVYTDATAPYQVTDNELPTKVGVAECKNILGLVALGDCSVKAAAKNGGISKVGAVDMKVNNILGIIATYTTTVSGK